MFRNHFIDKIGIIKDDPSTVQGDYYISMYVQYARISVELDWESGRNQYRVTLDLAFNDLVS